MLVHCHLFITLLRVGTFRWFSGPPCQEQTCRHQWVMRAVGARLVEASFTHADSHSRSGAVRGIRGCVGRVRVLFLGCGRSANKRFLWDKWSIDINSWMMWKAKGIDTPTAVFFSLPTWISSRRPRHCLRIGTSTSSSSPVTSLIWRTRKGLVAQTVGTLW